MQKLIISFAFMLLCLQATVAQQRSLPEQLINNLHGGVEVNNINGLKSYAAYAGTGYQYYFYDNKAYLMPQINAKWGQYKYGDYYANDVASVVVPATLGYNMIQSDLLTVSIYAGVRYEQIISSGVNTYTSDLNTTQFGFTPGASLRLFNRIGFSVSYYYALTSLYKDGSGNISAFNFAVNF